MLIEGFEFKHGRVDLNTRVKNPLYLVKGIVGVRGLNEVVQSIYKNEPENAERHVDYLSECSEQIDQIFRDGAAVNVSDCKINPLRDLVNDPELLLGTDRIILHSLRSLNKRSGGKIANWGTEPIGKQAYVVAPDFNLDMYGEILTGKVITFGFSGHQHEKEILRKLISYLGDYFTKSYRERLPVEGKSVFTGQSIVKQNLLEIVGSYGPRLRSMGLSPLLS